MSDTIKTGDKVEFNPTGKSGDEVVGHVLEATDRKVKVQPDAGGEPVSVFKKYCTVVAKGTRNAKQASAPKTKDKAPGKRAHATAQTGEAIVPLFRKDGQESKSITAGAKLDHYVKGAAKTAGGRPTFDVGDPVAEMFRGLPADEVIRQTAKKLTELTGERVTATSLEERYGKLNPGQIRMNCGNRLRAAMRAAATEES